MMQSPAENLTAERPAPSCWSEIGVGGDRSCPRLPQTVHCRNCPVFSEAGQQLYRRPPPRDYLEEWTRQLAETPAAAADATRSLLVFRLGDEWLALPARSIVEVVATRPVHWVPHRSDRLFLGLVNIRGELQLCVSLGELLGIEPAQAADPKPASASVQPRLIVAEQGANRWVFPADEVLGVQSVPASAMEDLPHTVEKSPRFHTEAIFSHENRRIGALAPARLFQALERTVR